ncbi:MAG: dephospho-CoA kinase [Chloroflexota bacterium]|nr:dephospho-CoA kinase [Chloroflexota bacterium]
MNSTRPPVLGLTGNIATGKSLVSGWLADRGATVIDSDRIVHEMYGPDHPVAIRVGERFGADLIGPGGVDRAKLGELVFADPAALAELEAIVHPAVFEAVGALIAKAPPATPHVIEAIKLVEGRNVRLLDALWVLESPRREQIARLRLSRNLSAEQAGLRIGAQSSAAEKLELFRSRRPGTPARIIGNHGSLMDLERGIDREWERFLDYCAGQ